ncbi:hypothetical protein CRYUN_Cryun05aG0226200 [Craigia yunnanensis]
MNIYFCLVLLLLEYGARLNIDPIGRNFSFLWEWLLFYIHDNSTKLQKHNDFVFKCTVLWAIWLERNNVILMHMSQNLEVVAANIDVLLEENSIGCYNVLCIDSGDMELRKMVEGCVTMINNGVDPLLTEAIGLSAWYQLAKMAIMMKIKTPEKGRVKRELEKRAPKLVETGKKTLILQVWFTLKEATDNLVIGRMYDHHIYDLVEVGVENFKSIESFTYDKKLAPRVGSKPFIAFVGEGFENVDELKHLKEVLLDLLQGEVVENINLAGLDRAYVCTARSSNRVYLMHCAMRLKKSGSVVPRMELVELGPSMDLVVWRHRLPNEGLRKEAMKTAKDQPKKKVKNVSSDAVQGTIGKIYIPDRNIGDMALPNKGKGVKRERREAKKKEATERALKKLQKEESE